MGKHRVCESVSQCTSQSLCGFTHRQKGIAATEGYTHLVEEVVCAHAAESKENARQQHERKKMKVGGRKESREEGGQQAVLYALRESVQCTGIVLLEDRPRTSLQRAIEAVLGEGERGTACIPALSHSVFAEQRASFRSYMRGLEQLSDILAARLHDPARATRMLGRKVGLQRDGQDEDSFRVATNSCA
jgi:hypothetical protein